MTVVVIAPLYFIVYFSCNLQKLREDQTYMAKFETVFEATKINNLGNLLYSAIFMFRRLMFVLTCIYLEDEGKFIFQILYAIVESLIFILYLIRQRPQKNDKDNNLELYTELSMLSFIYVMTTFTDYVQDPTAKFNLGFVAAGIFFLNIAVGLGAVIREQVVNVK
jgi:hypothetical protein